MSVTWVSEDFLSNYNFSLSQSLLTWHINALKFPVSHDPRIQQSITIHDSEWDQIAIYKITCKVYGVQKWIKASLAWNATTLHHHQMEQVSGGMMPIHTHMCTAAGLSITLSSNRTTTRIFFFGERNEKTGCTSLLARLFSRRSPRNQYILLRRRRRRLSCLQAAFLYSSCSRSCLLQQFILVLKKREYKECVCACLCCFSASFLSPVESNNR